MTIIKKALVLGAGGFIGTHLVSHLVERGFWVRGVDIKHPEYSETDADEFIVADLSTEAGMSLALDQPFDEIFQLAADMGGAGYIFSGENDAQVMRNSSLINLLFLNVLVLIMAMMKMTPCILCLRVCWH